MSSEIPVIDTPVAFATALRWGFEQSLALGARRIVLADPDFGAWPLDDAALLRQLGGWLRLPGRALVLLARHYDEVPRRLPRFTSWRRDWAHAMTTLQAGEDAPAELPRLLVADRSVSVQLIDAASWRGQASLDERRAQALREELDAILQRSGPAFAVRTLGL